jgi:hypothetical protein
MTSPYCARVEADIGVTDTAAGDSQANVLGVERSKIELLKRQLAGRRQNKSPRTHRMCPPTAAGDVKPPTGCFREQATVVPLAELQREFEQTFDTGHSLVRVPEIPKCAAPAVGTPVRGPVEIRQIPGTERGRLAGTAVA